MGGTLSEEVMWGGWEQYQNGGPGMFEDPEADQLVGRTGYKENVRHVSYNK